MALSPFWVPVPGHSIKATRVSTSLGTGVAAKRIEVTRLIGEAGTVQAWQADELALDGLVVCGRAAPVDGEALTQAGKDAGAPSLTALAGTHHHLSMA